jgi:hypothetical protein
LPLPALSSGLTSEVGGPSSPATGSVHLDWLKRSDDERRQLSDDRADRKKPSTSTNQYGIRRNVIKVDRRKRLNAIFDATSDAG